MTEATRTWIALSLAEHQVAHRAGEHVPVVRPLVVGGATHPLGDGELGPEHGRDDEDSCLVDPTCGRSEAARRQYRRTCVRHLDKDT